MKKLNTDIIINQFIKKHGYKYDYSLVNYNGLDKKVDIICPIHGIFHQIPKSHRNGTNCPRCSNINNNFDFIKKSKSIHNNKYDYSLVNYIGTKIKVKIICKEHGVFLISPNDHLSGIGCKICANNIRNKKNTSNTIEFIKKCKLVHSDNYNYELVQYNKAIIKVCIICKEHGVFYQTPQNHLGGNGCPKCKTSMGERKVIKYLIEHNIKYEYQKKFIGCKRQNYLPFDFYLPNYNICIEYDGEQHYCIIKYWGDKDGFMKRQENDKIKTDFCKDNNIKLIRIKYNENIDDKLLTIFI